MLPAAPKQWPIYDLFAVILILLFYPINLEIACISESSPVGVDVAWQLMWSN